MNTKITSREFWRSVIIAFLSTVLTAVIASLNAGHFPELAEIKIALMAGGATLLGAILKYLSTDTVASAKADIQAAIKPGEQVTVTKSK